MTSCKNQGKRIKISYEMHLISTLFKKNNKTPLVAKSYSLPQPLQRRGVSPLRGDYGGL